MPFKRAGWLQPELAADYNRTADVSMPFKRAGWLQHLTTEGRRVTAAFQCPLSGLVGCNQHDARWAACIEVSMPFKRAGWLQQVVDEIRHVVHSFNAL